MCYKPYSVCVTGEGKGKVGGKEQKGYRAIGDRATGEPHA